MRFGRWRLGLGLGVLLAGNLLGLVGCTTGDDPAVHSGAPEPSTAEPTASTSSDEPVTDQTVADIPDAAEPEDPSDWETPAVALVVTGNQHGYLEPCGCTGLDRQKGGVARRYTFLQSLRAKNWPLIPLDVGNQVRRFGKQAAIKLQQTVRALDQMDYQAVGFGAEDIRMPVGELLSVAAIDESPSDTLYVSANVVLFDPSMMPQTRIVERGALKIGVTSVLDPDWLEVPPPEELIVNEIVPAARQAFAALQAQDADFKVMLFFGTEDRAKQLAAEVKGYDLMVVSGEEGLPTYQPIEVDQSDTQIILTGPKGMYAGVVGLYADSSSPSGPKPTMKYARVELSHRFDDAPAMRQLMRDYQDELREVGLDGMGLEPLPFPTDVPGGRTFVGTATCGKCHQDAMEVWEGSDHAHATDSIIKPPEERGDVARHFDPECLSCHVTGWNAQQYYPYRTGYLSLETSAHLKGNGCENCHGPGAEHSAAEAEGSPITAADRDRLRAAMRLTLDQAREKCVSCHDLDNSPDFHDEDAFEEVYWPQVEH